MLTRSIDNVSTSTSIVGYEIDLYWVYVWAVQFIWDGTTNGTVKIQGTVDGETWNDIAGTSFPTGGAPGGYFFNASALVGYMGIRPVYTRTSGSGTLSCFISGKEQTVTSENAASFIDVGEKYVRTSRFATISSGTSGTITLPPNSQVVLDDFGGSTDAVLSKIVSGKPNYENVKTVGFTVIATSFDSAGNYSITGTPSSYPIAIIYRVRQQIKDFDSTSSDILGGVDFDSGPGSYLTSNIDGGKSNSTYGGTIPIDGGSSTSF